MLDSKIQYYSPNKSKYILCLTPMCLFTSLLTFYRQQYAISSCEFCLYITSVIHWSNPSYGWKRNLDIFISTVNIITHLYYIYISMCNIAFYCAIITLISFYISLTYSSYTMHGIAWIFACTGNIYLSSCLSNCLYY